MENLSSVPNNDLLNSVEVGVDSTSVFITEMLCSKVFGRVPDVSDRRFLRFFCNLACSTKQQSACSLCSLETLRDNLRELFLMVS